jgi:hypothetical protein
MVVMSQPSAIGQAPAPVIDLSLIVLSERLKDRRGPEFRGRDVGLLVLPVVTERLLPPRRI